MYRELEQSGQLHQAPLQAQNQTSDALHSLLYQGVPYDQAWAGGVGVPPGREGPAGAVNDSVELNAGSGTKASPRAWPTTPPRR